MKPRESLIAITEQQKALEIDKAALKEPHYPKAEILIGAFISHLASVRHIDPVFGLRC